MVVQSTTTFSSLAELLQRRAMETPLRRLYTFLGDSDGDESDVSYGELDERARGIGAMLQTVAAPGERAVLLYPPGLEYIAGFCGCLYAAVVAVPAYPPDPMRLDRTLPRLRAMVKDAGATVVLTTGPILAMANFVLEQAPELRSLRWIATDALPAADEHAWRRPALSSDTLAFLQYTSGSTGEPKGVMLSHGNLLHNLKLICHGFQIRPDDVGVLWLPPYHDMGLIGGILEPLYAGFEMALMSPVSFLRRPLRWLEAISRRRATIGGGPNFAFDLCARKVTAAELERLDLSSWHVAFCGAEPIRAETLDRFSDVFGRCGFRREAIYPCYGLAESTLIVSGGDRAKPPAVHTLDAQALARHRAVRGAPSAPGTRAHVGCGRALPELELLIVDPETSEPCPRGEVGEIWVSGPSIARGYWGKPDETERTFHAQPRDGGPRRYLRTGDLGLVLDDGELLVTGRVKDVIIIRGRNHYPQDLERTVEESHKAVRPGCSAAFSQDVATGEQLAVVAEVSQEVSAGRDPTRLAAIASAIRQAISREHELVVHTVVLLPPGAILKTSSGKIQRRAMRQALASGALPVVARSDEAEAAGDGVTELGAGPESSGPDGAGALVRDALAAAPAAERGGLLLALLRHELARELRQDPSRIDAGATAAALGLDSLGMVAVEGRLEAALAVPVPEAFLWRHATLAAAAEELVSMWEASAGSPGPAGADAAASASAAGDTAAVSSGQARLWFLDKLYPDSAAYNIFSGLRLSGPLDEAALDRSLTALAWRHAVLRTRFVAGDDGVPHAVIVPPAPVALAVVDLRGRPPETREAELRALGRSESSRPFDLAAGPLFRATLVRLAGDDHALVLTMHHTVTDGWSMSILTGELATLYRQVRRGEPPLLPPAPRYDEYARREHAAGSALAAQRAFWKRTLDGLPRLELPIARPRSGPPSPRGATHRFSLPAELVERVREVARTRGTTLFTAMLAGVTALLHRYSGQSDFAIGTVAANRGRLEHRNLVGFLANTLVLRIDAAHDPSFVELIDRSRRRVSEALAHAELPFDDVVRLSRQAADLDRNPLFQAAFFMESLPPLDLEVPGMTWAPILDVPDGSVEDTAKFDLTLMMAESASRGGASLACQYSTDQFDEPSIRRLVAHFEVLLRALCEAPSRPVSQLPLLTEPERRRMLVDWNATAADYPRDATIHRLFAEQVVHTPEATAVTFGDTRLRYAELDRRSSRLAARLVASGVGPETRVGLYLERSAELVVGLLGILKSGAAYVPLDPAYPAERVAFVLADAGVSALVTQEHLAAELPDPRCPVLWIDDAAAAAETLPAREPVQDIDPASLAYVIYTSGSTGRPKGVMIAHGSVVNFFASMDRRVGAEPPGVFLALTSVAFDISVLELLWAVTRGFHVVVHSAQSTAAIRAGDPPRRQPAARTVPEQIAAHGVTHLQCTPSLAQGLLVDLAALHAERALAGLRALLVGGEALPTPLAARLSACAPGRVINMYGPTETTIWSATHAVGPDEAGTVVSIGTPIGNTALYVLDAGLEPVPVGVTGELYIGGAGLARGYHGRAALTAERFVPDPFAGRGARMYRTGDLARFRDDGSIDFLGRVDQQVKLRGFRIELGEIEATLAEHPGVHEVAVAVREDRAGDQRLVAYVVPRGLEPPDAEELRRLARRRLPDYMVPSAVVALEAMPMTPNGKLDRKRLPAPVADRAELPDEYVAPRTPVEDGVARLFGKLLGHDLVGAHDDFFALGGHSLLATQVASQLHAMFHVELPVRTVFEARTPARLAEHINVQNSASATEAAAPIQRRRWDGEDPPLSFAQRRLWFLEQLTPGQATYNIPIAIRLRGALDVPLLQATFAEIVRRHQALRTTFRGRDGEPVQHVGVAPATWEIPVVDVSAFQEAAREGELARRLAEEARRPFNLTVGPLLRTVLMRLEDDVHVLFLNMHHIVSDTWSMGVLMTEVATLYKALREGKASPLPDLPIQYADFAKWQTERLTGELVEAQLAYWKHHLAGVPPLLELPTDHHRPAVQSQRGDCYDFTLPAALVSALKRTGQLRGATLFMTLLAAYQVLLARYSSRGDICVGIPIANRIRTELDPLIGFFVNTLAIRADLSDDPSFDVLLARVKQATLGAYANQELPFDRIVEAVGVKRELSRSPLIQVTFAFQNVQMPAPQLDGLEVSVLPVGTGAAKFDLSLSLMESPQGLEGQIEYREDLFEPATIASFAGHYQSVLEAIVADPGRRIGALPLIGAKERTRLLQAGRVSREQQADAPCIHLQIAAQAQRTPEAVALLLEGRRLGYGELDVLANRGAQWLVSRDVRPGSRVALSAEQWDEAVVGALAIWKAGAVVHCDGGGDRGDAGLPALGPGWLDALEPGNDARAAEAVPVDAATSVAAVIHGCSITHAALARYGGALSQALQLAPAARLIVQSCRSPWWELLAALGAGATVVASGAGKDALQGAAAAMLSPSALEAVPAEIRETLEVVVIDGAIDGPLDDGAASLPGGCEVLEGRWTPPGILLVDGCATALEAHVLEPSGQPAPFGVWGELCLGSLAPATEPARDRFVPHPDADNADNANPLLYRTAQRVRRREDGALQWFDVGRPRPDAAPDADPNADHDAATAEQSAAPITDTERALIDIWRQILRVEEIGVHDSFFEIGGNSLLSLLMLSRVQDVLNAEVPLRTFFEAPTIGSIATCVDAARHGGDAAGAVPPLSPVPRDGELALSFAQQRLWFLDQLDPGTALYNIPFTVKIRGRLHVEPLRMAFEHVVHRHEVLRTTFSVRKGHPLQVVHPPERWALPMVDLSGRTDPELEVEVQRRVQELARQAFALDQGPLLRAMLLRLSNDQHVLVMCMHHIVSDGWSVGVLVEEVSRLYQAFSAGRASPLPPLTLQYADYAVWQRSWLTGDVLAPQLAYWKDKLTGAPPLDLPTDRPRPPVRSLRGSSYFFTMPGSLMGAVQEVALQGGATPFMVLLGTFYVLLGRYSNQDDLSVGTPIANRTRPELESLIGFFVNTLVMRADLSGDPSFLELLQQIKDTALGAYAHQDIPFEHLVDDLSPTRTLNRPPLFQVLFALQNAPMQAPHLEGLELSVLPVETGTAKFDLTLALMETPQGLEGQLEYSEDLFELATITRIAGHYQCLLEAIVADPGRRIGALPLIEHGLLHWHEAVRPHPAIDQEVASPALHTTPSETEQAVLAIWREVLEVDAVGLHDNFFALGGNSLMSVLLLAQIQDTFGVELPVRALFETPTAAAVAERIDDARRRPGASDSNSAAPPSSLLLPLRTVGTRPPVFFVHAIAGSALAYQHLAEHLGDDQPFYGLHAMGVDDDAAPSTDVREMARRYVEAVRSVAPEGPYHLGGWSFGGLVALEMAHQLRTAGQPVSTLALVDTWALSPEEYNFDEVTIIDTLVRELGLEVPPGEIAALPSEARVPRVAALAAQMWLVQADGAERRIRRFLRVIAAHLEAARRYVPPQYPEPITLLRAKELPSAAIEKLFEIDPSLGWHTRTGLQVQVHVVPGNHFSVIRPPHVRALADTLRSVSSIQPHPRR
jgi:amino acid adenylation domain-containing protein